VWDSCPRSRRSGGRSLALLLLAAALLPAGCPSAGKRASLPAAEEELLAAKGDARLLTAVREGGRDPFAAIAVFRRDTFLGQAAMLEQASIPILDEFGKAAILLLSTNQVVPLLKDPSVRRLVWFGPQGLLARLDPSLEMELLSRYDSGAEGKDVSILVRFRDVPGEKEEREAAAAGFRVVSRVGPNLVVSGPISGLPRLLESDRIIYMEKASNPSPGEPRSIPILRPKPPQESSSPEKQR